MNLGFEIDKNNLKNGVLTFIKKAMPLTFLTAVLCLVGLYFLNKNYVRKSSADVVKGVLEAIWRFFEGSHSD